MRLCTLFIATSLLAGSAFAQTAAQNQIEIWPGTTSFTSRGNISVGTGETLQGFHKSHWAGISDDGSTTGITGLFSLTQDQNGLTQETFQWVFRSGTDAAGPTTGTAGEIAVTGNLMTPPRTTGGPVAWGLSSTLSTPIVVPNDAFFAAGHRLPASPSWTSDGQSTHASTSAVQGSSASQGDHAWQIVGTAGATHPSSQRSWRYGIRTNARPVLQLYTGPTPAAGAPQKGMGGMFPKTDSSISYGLSIVDGNASAAASVVWFIGTARLPGVPIATFGRVYCNPVVALPGAAFASGASNNILADPLPAVGTAKLYFQAAVIDGANIALTNMQGADF